jgi:hypothetical protein
MRTLLRVSLFALALTWPGAASAAVQTGQPFPSDLYTTPDATQLTGLRIDLPQPNCGTNPPTAPTSPIIIQFARGDKTVPNPTTSAILRAGDLVDRATIFRNDLAKAANPAVSSNPHTFLTNLTGAGAPYAAAAQQQIATFLASDGATTIDPDGAGPFFETPTSLVPEDLAYIP